MAKKLHYFNINGLAEPIRYILHYGKEKFEEIRYDRAAWPIPEVKESLPFGQLPLYEEGKRTLNQSLAIARYVAGKHNLLPSDPWDQAVLDAWVYNIYDFLAKVRAYLKEQQPDRKQELKKEILEESVEFFFSRFEERLKENNGIFGGHLSWADFILVGAVEAVHLFLGVEVQKKYPAVEALVEKIINLPGVKEYIASRKPYVHDM